MQSANEQNNAMRPPAASQKTSRASVGLRWLTALILIPIVLLLALLGGWWSFAGVTLVMVLCTFELHAMMLHTGHRPLLWMSLAISTIFLLMAVLPSWRWNLLEFGLGGALLLSFAWLMVRKNLEGAVIDWALTLASPLYIGWSLSYMLLIRGFEPSFSLANGFSFSLPRGMLWLLVTLLGVWGFDSAAFFCGRYLGRHKLAPRISPAKTWEGTLGGLVLSIAASLLITVGPLGVPWYLAVLLGVLIGAAATLGDLAESLLKRQTHVKDSGQIMPGHGGMLDRVDSLMFVSIIVYLFAQLLGK